MSDNISAVSALPVQHRAAALSADIFADPAAFDHAQRVAKVFASSNLVPAHFRGNVADCLIALQIARRLGEEPLTAMQSMFIISGKPGWLTSYMISRANRSGIFHGPINWDESGSGEALSVTAKAVLAVTGEEVRITTDMRMAKAEGWTTNKKYTSMPSHMLRWRSAAMLIRLYCPEVMLGMPVVEELETVPSMRDVTPHPASMKDALDQFANAAPANSSMEATAANGVGADRESMEAQPMMDIGIRGRVSTQSQAAPAQPPGLPAFDPPAPEPPTGQTGVGAAPARQTKGQAQ